MFSTNIMVTPITILHKSRERKGPKKPAELPKRPNNEKAIDKMQSQRQGQLKRWNKDKHIYNEDVMGWLLSREKSGYSKRERLAAESAEGTEAGLQQLRTNQHERLGAEERGARLQQLRTNQHEKLAATNSKSC